MDTSHMPPTSTNVFEPFPLVFGADERVIRAADEALAAVIVSDFEGCSYEEALTFVKDYEDGLHDSFEKGLMFTVGYEAYTAYTGDYS